MEYIEIQVEGIPSGEHDRLTASLLELGYDSFSEEEGHYAAYIPDRTFNEDHLRDLLNQLFPGKEVAYSFRAMEEKNWNEEWEQSYQPVMIDNRCRVRAPFHDPDPRFPYEIVIEPKMSFGTAHHETTAMMLRWLLDEPATGKHVLDMGCGTGILAILAARMGAKEVRAIDHDEWAFENAKENCLRNNVPQVHVIHGSDGSIPSGPFDLVLANINRNILLDQIPVYARVMAAGGVLVVSGFYTDDLDAIRSKAEESGLHFSASREERRWMAVKFIK